MASDACESPEGAREQLEGVDAVLVPGGFGVRGLDGKIGALRHARENLIPTLGICLGLQCMVIEAARHLLGLPEASSTEFDPDAADPVIATMAEQRRIRRRRRGPRRDDEAGSYPASLAEGSLVAQAYGAARPSERHRHRYEVNSAYCDRLESAGLRVSGTSP